MADRPRRNSKKPDRLSDRQNDAEHFRRQTELAKLESLKLPRPSASAAPKPAGTINKTKNKKKDKHKKDTKSPPTKKEMKKLIKFQDNMIGSLQQINAKNHRDRRDMARTLYQMMNVNHGLHQQVQELTEQVAADRPDEP